MAVKHDQAIGRDQIPGREGRERDGPSLEGAAGGERFFGCDLPPDADLVEQGWEWRCNADERRSREMVDTYRELGFEVTLRPVDAAALCDACGGCAVGMAEVSAVYVRKTPSSG